MKRRIGAYHDLISKEHRVFKKATRLFYTDNGRFRAVDVKVLHDEENNDLTLGCRKVLLTRESQKGCQRRRLSYAL